MGQVGAPQFPTHAAGAAGAGPVPHHAPASTRLQHLFLITASFQSIRENISLPSSPPLPNAIVFLQAWMLGTCPHQPRMSLKWGRSQCHPKGSEKGIGATDAVAGLPVPKMQLPQGSQQRPCPLPSVPPRWQGHGGNEVCKGQVCGCQEAGL